MKTFKVALLGLLFLGMGAQAQKIYVRGGLGIAVSTSADYTYNFATTNGSTTTATVNKKGIGTGLPFVLAGGYKLSAHFALELGVDYFYGFSLQSKNTGSSYSSDSKWRGQMLSVVPAFVMSIPFEKFQPYARLGLKLGVLNRVIYQDKDDYTAGMKVMISDVQSKSRDYGGIAIGAQAALGTDFKLSNQFSLFAEIQLDGISYSPKHGKYTEYLLDGIEQLGAMAIRDKEWDYEDDATLSNSTPDDEPGKQVKRNFTFGNAGLLLGVKVNF